MMHHAGQAAQVCDVETAGVGRSVGAHQAGAVDGEADRQALLQRHVVHHLVVGALQERRIDGAERRHAFGRHAGGEGHRVLLGDPDIEAPVRERRGRTGRCPVPDGMAAVTATMRGVGRRLPAISASANTRV